MPPYRAVGGARPSQLTPPPLSQPSASQPESWTLQLTPQPYRWQQWAGVRTVFAGRRHVLIIFQERCIFEDVQRGLDGDALGSPRRRLRTQQIICRNVDVQIDARKRFERQITDKPQARNQDRKYRLTMMISPRMFDQLLNTGLVRIILTAQRAPRCNDVR